MVVVIYVDDSEDVSYVGRPAMVATTVMMDDENDCSVNVDVLWFVCRAAVVMLELVSADVCSGGDEKSEDVKNWLQKFTAELIKVVQTR